MRSVQSTAEADLQELLKRTTGIEPATLSLGSVIRLSTGTHSRHFKHFRALGLPRILPSFAVARYPRCHRSGPRAPFASGRPDDLDDPEGGPK